MKPTVILSLLLCFSTANADGLLPDQKLFLKSYLGLTKRELDRKFKVEALPEDELGRYYGRVHPTRPDRIEMDPRLSAVLDNGLRRNGTILHEAIHLYTYEHRPHEEEWVLEGIALLGEFLYDLKQFGKEAAFYSFLPIASAYLNAPTQSLTSFDSSAHDQGKVFLFFLYLHQTFQGDAFSRAHFQANGRGMVGVAEAIQTSQHAGIASERGETETFYISHFFESIKNDRNMLATKNNDLFTQLLLHDSHDPI